VFFLGICKWLDERKLFLHIKFKPVLKPETSLAGREAKGEIGWSDGVASWNFRFVHNSFSR
jgi:hypothetical protein